MNLSTRRRRRCRRRRRRFCAVNGG